jgi:hypothetical protein
MSSVEPGIVILMAYDDEDDRKAVEQACPYRFSGVLD